MCYVISISSVSPSSKTSKPWFSNLVSIYSVGVSIWVIDVREKGLLDKKMFGGSFRKEKQNILTLILHLVTLISTPKTKQISTFIIFRQTERVTTPSSKHHLGLSENGEYLHLLELFVGKMTSEKQSFRGGFSKLSDTQVFNVGESFIGCYPLIN